MNTKAIRFEQNGRVFYSVVLPASEAVRLTQVDIWDPDNPNAGYQRAPSEARKRQIGQFLTHKDSILPIGGLVNARPLNDQGNTYGTVLRFDREVGDDTISYGTLHLPEKDHSLYVVDMQHRLGGLEWAMKQEDNKTIGSYPVVMTIADGMPRIEEVEQFDLINTTQKKVNTALARRLKSEMSGIDRHKQALIEQGREWEAKGPRIVDMLNKTPGIWLGRIQPPNKSKKDMPTAVIRETSFVTSLKPVLLTPFFVRHKEKDIAELLGMYWEAVQQIFPECFRNPEDYVLQKTPGIFSMHELAPDVFELARDKGPITVETLAKCLGPLKDIDTPSSNFWHRDNEDGAARFGSMKGFRILASMLRQNLPDLMLHGG